MIWMLLPVLLVLLPFPAVGQRESYGDFEHDVAEISKGRISALYPYDIYEPSTLRGAARDVVYDMWKACEKELGNPVVPQVGDRRLFRVDFMSFYVDSRGRILRLVLYASRKAETEKEDARMQRLFGKLKKVRFPPFDRRDIPEVQRDSMYFGYTVPHLRRNVSREGYVWW